MKRFSALLLLVALVGGLFSWQRNYARRHLPLIEAGLAAADAAGSGVLESVGVPEGAVPFDEILKTYPAEGRRSMWRGVSCRVRWQRAWTMPGTHEEVERWYRERLASLGWEPHEPPVPSALERTYLKGRWRLLLQRRADFSADREPSVRHAIVLEWDYWLGEGEG